jgi:hypothetical protein
VYIVQKTREEGEKEREIKKGGIERKTKRKTKKIYGPCKNDDGW